MAQGTLDKPASWDPLLDILRERGLEHERAYLEHLRNEGFEPITISGIKVTDDAVAETLEAMRSGHELIVQAALKDRR